MRAVILTACAVSMLLAACDGAGNGVRISSTRTSDDGEGKGALKVVDTLQCPQTAGVLTRKGSASAEGKVCTYAGPRGAEVSLELVALGDAPVDEVLKSFEQRLSADLPAAAAATDSGAERMAVATSEGAAGDAASVRMPGISIDARGDKADVKIGPITIRADDTDAQVNISDDGETVNIQAHDDGAEVRTRDAGAGTRATWVLTDSRRRSEGGWRSVGYQARGPEGGPIVVATIRSKDRSGDRIFDAAGDLLRLNVGE